MCRNKYDVKRQFHAAITAHNERLEQLHLYRIRPRNKKIKKKKHSQYNKTQNKKATMKLGGFAINILTEHSMSPKLTS